MCWQLDIDDAHYVINTLSFFDFTSVRLTFKSSAFRILVIRWRGREIFNFFLLTYEENVNILQSIFSMFVSILSSRFRCSELVPPVMLFHWRPSYWNTHQGTAIPRWKHVLMSSSMNYGWVESACRMIKNYQNSSILQHKVRNLKIRFCWIFCFWAGKFPPWLLILNLILPGEPGNEAWCSWLRWPLGLELWEIREISGDLREI